MANIKKVVDKNGKESWKVTISVGRRPDGRQILKSKVFHPDPKKSDKTNEKELQRFIYEFEKKCLSGEIEADKMTLQEFGEKWLKSYVDKELEKTTQYRYRNGLEHNIFPAIGHLKLSQIKASTVQNLLSDMREKGYDYGGNRKGSYSDESIRTTKIILSSLLSAAVEDGLIQTNPCSVRTRKHKKVSTKKKQKKSFTINETIKFLDIIEKPIPITVPPRRATRHGKETAIAGYVLKDLVVDIKFQTLFVVTVFSGVRREEILGLQWKDIDFKNMTIDINKSVQYVPGEPLFVKAPKSEAGYRKIFLPPACMDKLLALKKEQEKEIQELGTYWKGNRDIEESWCFTQDDGQVMHPSTPLQKLVRVLKAYNKSCKKEEDMLPVITFHELRHTSASILIAQGMEVTAVAKRLGHADASTTLRVYAHSFEERDRTASNLLENVLLKGNDSEDTPD